MREGSSAEDRKLGIESRKVKELALTGKGGIFPLLYKERGIMQVGL